MIRHLWHLKWSRKKSEDRGQHKGAPRWMPQKKKLDEMNSFPCLFLWLPGFQLPASEPPPTHLPPRNWVVSSAWLNARTISFKPNLDSHLLLDPWFLSRTLCNPKTSYQLNQKIQPIIYLKICAPNLWTIWKLFLLDWLNWPDVFPSFWNGLRYISDYSTRARGEEWMRSECAFFQTRGSAYYNLLE